MKSKDYAYRFEETLRSSGLEFTVQESTGCDVAGLKITHKAIRIKPRCDFDIPLLVNLTLITRAPSFHRRARTSASCFVVRDGATEKGLRNVWIAIRVHCLPLR